MSTKKEKADTAAQEAAEQTYLAEHMHVSETEEPEQKSENVYTYQMNSTVEETLGHDDFWKLKLSA